MSERKKVETSAAWSLRSGPDGRCTASAGFSSSDERSDWLRPENDAASPRVSLRCATMASMVPKNESMYLSAFSLREKPTVASMDASAATTFGSPFMGTTASWWHKCG